MVAAAQADLDGQLGVEILLLLGLGLEQLLLEPGGQSGLRDIDQQARHLGLAGELAQQRAEGALDVFQLLLVDLEVDGFGVLAAEFLAQLLFFGLVPLQLRALLVPDQEVDTHQRQCEKRRTDRAGAHRQGPAARIARIE